MSLDLHTLVIGFGLALGFVVALFVLSIVVPGPLREGALCLSYSCTADSETP